MIYLEIIALLIIGIIIGRLSKASLNIGISQEFNQGSGTGLKDVKWGEECYKGKGRCLSKNCEWKECQMKNKDYSPNKHLFGY